MLWVVLCVAAGPAWAQDDVGSIAGTVKAAGANYANIQICAHQGTDRTPRCVTALPARGWLSWFSSDVFPFRFAQLRKGPYTLTVTAETFRPYQPPLAIDVPGMGRQAPFRPKPIVLMRAANGRRLFPVESARGFGAVRLLPAAFHPGAGWRPPAAGAPPIQLGTLAGAVDAARRFVAEQPMMERLPLPGIRSFDTLALLSPGVFRAPAMESTRGPGISPGVGSAGQFVVNGMRSRDNNFTVDGSDSNEEDVGVRRQGFVALIPQSIESVDEYQVVTALGDARFGRNIGGIVNVLTRSGTSQFHGEGHVFFNDRRLNARDVFEGAYGTGAQQVAVPTTGRAALLDEAPLTVENPYAEKPADTRWQAGFTIGGPLRRKSERDTFLISLEGIGWHRRQLTNFAVPTVAERSVFDTGETGFWKLGSTRIPMTPASLPGNAIFSLYPFANNPAGPYGANTYSAALPADANTVMGSGRMDHLFRLGGKESRVSGRYNISDEDSVLPSTGGAIDSSLKPALRTQNLAFYFTTEFNERTAQIARISFGRTSSNYGPAGAAGMLPSDGLPGTPFLLNAPLVLNVTRPDAADTRYIRASSAQGKALARSLGYGEIANSEQITGPLGQVKIAGFSPVGVDVFNFPQRRANNTFQWADTFTAVRGTQAFTFGFDIRRTQINSNLDRNARPLALFGGLATPGGARLPIVTGAGCSEAAAGCVVPQPAYTSATLAAAGVPTGFFQTLAAQPDSSLGIRFTQYNFFFQDEIQVSPDLVLTAGVRYELNTVPGTVRDKLKKAFDPASLVRQAQAAQARCPGRCDDLVSFFQTIPDYSVGFGGDPYNVHPRVGIAWHPGNSGRFGLRAGFGTYSSPAPGVVMSQARSAFPNFIPLNLVNFPVNASDGPLLFNLANAQVRALNPFLNVVAPGTLNRLTPTKTDPVQLLASDLYSLRGAMSPTFPALDLVMPAKDLRDPRAYHFGITAESQLPGSIVASIAYVGTRGLRLFRTTTPELGLGRSLVQFDSNLLPVVARPAGAADVVFPNVGGIMRPPQISRVSNSFTVAPTIFESGGSSTYHSLQVEVRRRYRGSVEFGWAFTWSHSMDNASDFFDTAGAFALPQNSLKPDERAASNFDVRLRSATHFTWTLPCGRCNRLTGGWELAGIATFETGQPYTVNSSFDVNRDGNLTDRLQTTRYLTAVSEGRVRLRMDPAASPLAMLAADGQNGAVGRNTFRAPGIADVDLAVSKSVAVSERQRVRLRAEGFNVFNRAQFGVPVRILEAPGFGSAVNTAVSARVIQLSLKYMF